MHSQNLVIFDRSKIMEQTANPNILKSPIPAATVNELKKNPGGWFKKNIVKIIVVVLVLAVIAELVFGGLTLFSPSTTRNISIIPPKINSLQDATLSLVPDKTSYKKGDLVVIDVKLFTGGYTTDSTDLVIKYDPKFLEADAKTFAVQGQIYPEYPALQVDKIAGLIGISGITVPGGNGFSGVGTFAKLNFTALQDGQTQVVIDFESGKTADSNVVLSGSSKDILGSVSSADIVISDAADQPAVVSGGQKCESFTQYCQDTNGQVGSQACSSGSIKDGSCGYDPINTVTCEVCKIE